MTNILEFRPRQQPPEPAVEEPVAPDKLYWLQDLQLATHNAAFLENDMKAVTMLMQAQLDFMTRGTALSKLPEAVRRECAKYLILPKDNDERAKKIKAIVRAVYAGRR